MQRNHIDCPVLVWNCLAALAYEAGKTLYHLKRGLLSSYLRAELANPAVRLALVVRKS